jgi:hypothetical protein
MAKNCESLRKIQIFGILNKEFSSIFLEKFGQKIEFIDICGIQKSGILSILRSTSNLKAIKFHDNFDAVTEQYLPKLEEIIVKEFSYEWLEKFAILYNKQIKRANFEYSWDELNPQIVSFISRFENLESLKLEVHYYKCDEKFKSMAENLKKLKRLTISFANIDENFKTLKVFNNIEFFELILISWKNENIKIIETLNLTKLCLTYCYSTLSNESYEILSKMRRMSEIRLNIFNSKNTNDSGICHLIKNSTKLTTIELIDRHINETTLNAIIEKALSNPTTHFKFKVREIKKKFITEKMIPLNLSIQLCEYY